MDSWPTDDRIDHLNPSQRKGKRKSIPRYPHLDYGVQAVTLCEKNGRLEWTSIVKDTIKGQFDLVWPCRMLEIHPLTRKEAGRFTNNQGRDCLPSNSSPIFACA